ncbi:MAG TPA: FAD-binding oxidoreductase [Myxococcales bacterium]
MMEAAVDPKARSFWLGSLRYADSPPLEGAATADYAVIGAGFSGLATAYFLRRAEPSARIVVLEAERVGAGASGRCAGFVSTDFGLSFAATARTFGRARAREAHHCMEQAVELVERLVRHNRIECEYERVGLLRVATTHTYERRVREEVETARAAGLSGIEWLDAKAVRQQVDSPLFLGAAWEARAGLVNPAKLALGLKEVLVRAGVLFFEQTPARRIERKLGRLFVRTPKGGVLAGKLAITTNAYSQQFRGLSGKQVALYMHAIASEPLRPEQLEAVGWRRRQAVVDARNLARFYRLTGDGRLLIGGRNVSVPFGKGAGRELSPRTFQGLEDDARVLFPALKRLRFPHRWGGPISVPLQLVPAVGYLGSDRIVYSLGCMGHGLALAHLNGWTLCDLLRGERTERTEAFFVNRRVVAWPPGPLKTVLALAVSSLMKAEDAWNERGLPDVPKPAHLRLLAGPAGR